MTNAAIQHVPLTTPRDYTRAILREVAAAHGVGMHQLFDRDRRAHIAAAKRDAIVAIIRAKPNLSFPDIGRLLGLDHTTVLHHAHLAGITTVRGAPRPTMNAAE